MAIDWTKTIVVSDDKTTHVICGKSIIFALNRSNAQIPLGSMAYENDAPSNDGVYGRKNGGWVLVSEGGGGGTADLHIIAPEFSDNEDYPEGSYVVHEGTLYRFIRFHNMSGDWNPNDVVEVTVGDELKKINVNIAPEFSRFETYDAGQYVIYNGKLYRFIENHWSSGDWNESEAEEVNVVDEITRGSADFGSGVVAPDFSTSTIYYTGDYVIHEGKLYRFIEDHLSAGSWKPSQVEEVKITSDFINQQRLEDYISRMNNNTLAPVFNEREIYDVGEYVIHDGKLYEFTMLHNPGPWDSAEVEEVTAAETFVNNNRLVEAITMNNYAIIAPGFTRNSLFHEGEYTIYDGKLYRFNQNHNPAEWDSSEVTEVNVMSDIVNESKLDKAIQDNNSMIIAPPFAENYGTYHEGDYVIYDGKLYRFLQSHNPGLWNYAEVEEVTIPSDFINRVKLDEAIQNNNSKIIAPPFSENYAYLEGSYVIHDGYLYRFLVYHSGAWTGNDAVRITIPEEFINQLDLENAISNKLDVFDFAQQFDRNSIYYEGDYVIYEGHPYRFNTDKNFAGEWDASLVDEVTISEDFVDYAHLNGAISSSSNKIIAQTFRTNALYHEGEYVIYDGRLYKFLEDHNPGEWDRNQVEMVTVTSEFINQEGLENYIANINNTTLAPVYSEYEVYNEGEYVIHDGKLYQFIVDHNPGSWNSAEVEEVTAAETFVNSNRLVEAIMMNNVSIIASPFRPDIIYHVGDYVIYEGELYRFTQDTLHPIQWNANYVQKVKVTTDFINDLKLDDAIQSNNIRIVAPVFSTSVDYHEGDYAVYEGYLYRFTEFHVGAWDSTQVEQVTVSSDFVSSRRLIEEFQSHNRRVVAQTFNEVTAYNTGDYVTHNDGLYRFTADHEAGVWNSSEVEQVNITDEFVSLPKVYEVMKNALPIGSFSRWFSKTYHYQTGDYVYYDGNIYKFTADHEPGDWDDSEVELVVISEDFVDYNHLYEAIGETSLQNLAPEFEEDNPNYYTNMYVTHDGKLYRFWRNHTAQGWDSSEVEEIVITRDFIDERRLNKAIHEKNASNLAPAFSESETYYINDYVVYNGALYQFTKNHNAGPWIGDGQWKDVDPVLITRNFVDYLTYNTSRVKRSEIASAFDTSLYYKENKYVYYENVLYEFTQAHSPGPWNQNHVRAVNVMDRVAWNNERINQRANIDSIAESFSARNDYNYGDYVIYDTHLYRFIHNHQSGDWNADDVERVNVTDEMNLKYENNPSLIGILTGTYSVYVEDPYTSHLYKAGDYVLHKDQNYVYWRLYRFIKDHVGAWSFDDVEETVLTDDLSMLRDRIGAFYFNESTNYSIGDVVIHDEKLYKFVQNHPADEWTSIHVVETSIVDLLDDKLTNYVIASEFSTSQNYEIGDYVIYDGKLYCFLADHTAGNWNSQEVYETSVMQDLLDRRTVLEWLKEKASNASIAPEFSDQDNYAVGDYVMYEGQLYKFTTAHSSGAWNSQEVTEHDVLEMIEDVSQDVDIFHQSIADDFSTSSAYAVGDYVWYNNYLYRFNSAHSAGAWNSSEVSRIVVTNEFASKSYVYNEVKNRIHVQSVAPQFDATTNYSTDDYVTYDGYLYRFVSDHTAGAWDSSDVELVNVMNEVITGREAALKNFAVATSIAPAFSESEDYSADDYVQLDGVLYKFIARHTAGEWDPDDVTEIDMIGVVDSVKNDIEISEKLYFVDYTNGSDQNDGSINNPFKTIQNAVNMVPSISKGTIHIYGGAYNESVSVVGKHIVFGVDSSISISNLTITNSNVSILGENNLSDNYDTITISNRVSIDNSDVYTEKLNITIGDDNEYSSYRIEINNSKVVFKTGKIKASGSNTVMGFSTGYYAIRAYNSYVYVHTFETNAKNHISVADGSIFCYVNYTNLYDELPLRNPKHTYNGGRIYNGTGIDFGTMAAVDDVSQSSDYVFGRTKNGWRALINDFYTESEVDALLDGLQDELESQIEEKEDKLAFTHTGSIAYFNNSDGMATTKCTIDIPVTQDTAGHDPQDHGSSKNIIPPIESKGNENGNLTVDSYGKCTLDVVNGKLFSYPRLATFTLNAGTYTFAAHNPVAVPSASEYDMYPIDLYISNSPSAGTGGSGTVKASLKMTSVNNKATFTLSQTETLYIHLSSYNSQTWGYMMNNFVFYPMLETGSTAHSYEPYSNICPIPVFTGLKIYQSNKNLTDVDDITVNNSLTEVVLDSLYLQSGDYKLSFHVKDNINSNYNEIGYIRVVAGVHNYTHNINGKVDGKYSLSFTLDEPSEITIVSKSNNLYWIAQDGSFDLSDVQLEQGSTATDFEAHNGERHTIDWESVAGTIGGGTLDVQNGILTVTHRQIASYDGETLPGEWLSDRDVYSSGGTPTTGAQVVYELSTPEVYQITPTKITPILGENIIYSDINHSEIYIALVRNKILIDYIDGRDEKLQEQIDDIQDHIDDIQDTLTFDDVPTENSTNLVKSGGIKTALTDKADIIHTSASGSLVHITDGAAYPVDALSVGIEPVQDLHGYANPWPAGGGKNLLNYQDWDTMSSINIVSNTPTELHITSDGLYKNQAVRIGNSDDLRFPTGTYYIKFSINANAVIGKRILFGFRGSDNVFTKYISVNSTAQTNFSGILTTEAPCYFSILTGDNTNDGSSASDITISNLIVSTTDVPFEPYANICPISGHSETTVTRRGKNLCRIPDGTITHKSVTYTTVDGITTANGTATGGDAMCATGIFILPAGSYRISDFSSDTVGNIYIQDTTSNVSWPVIASTRNSNYPPNFTIEKPTKVILRCYINSGTTATNRVFMPMLTVGSDTPDTFEVGNISTVTIDLGDTRYGGTLDVLTGVLTINRAIIEFDGSTSGKTVNMQSSLNTDPTYKNAIFWNSGHSGAYFVSQTQKCGLVCDKLQELTDGQAYSTVTAQYGCFVYAEQASNPNISHQPRIVLPKTLNILTTADANQWLQDVGGVSIVYKLVTPQTVQLDPESLSLLLGENNIWADTGNTSVSYRADTKLYIDGKIAEAVAELQALILEN